MKRLAIILSCVVLTVLSAQGQLNTNRTLSISLQDAISMAVSNNLGLEIARFNPQIARLELEGSFDGWDPLFSAGGSHSFSLSGGGIDPNTKLPLPSSSTDQNSFNSSVSGLAPWGLNYSLQGNIAESYGNTGAFPYDNTRGSALLNLRQPLLKNFWIDSTRLNIRVNKIALKQSELGLRQTIMDTVTAAELAYFNLIAARESVVVQEKAVELAARLAQENKRRVEVGALAPLEEKQAEAQAASSRADLLQARRALAAAENTLKGGIVNNYAAWAAIELVPSDSLPAPLKVFDLQNSWARALTERPALMQARLDLERQGVVLKYNHNQLFPELDLTGTYGHSTGGSDVHEYAQGFDELRQGNKPFYSYGAQISIPLGNTGARSRYKVAKLERDRLVLALRNLEQNIMIEVDDAIKLAKASYERIKATREASAYAQEALAAEQKKLESGKSTSFQVLELQKNLTDARNEEIRALTEYNRNLAQLSLLEASTLERLGINMEVK